MKFIIDNIWLLGVSLLSGTALLIPLLQRRGDKITTLQATQLINQGKTMLLDVRETAEFATGHIRDAKNIPVGELTKRIAELAKFKEKSIVILCHTGIRSSKAATQLKNAGFTDVLILNGGMSAWQTQSLPVVK